jgi:DNA topoisomerase-2
MNELKQHLYFLPPRFQQMSFVNSIATTKGGRHVDYVTELVVKGIIETIKKKNKTGINIKPFQVIQLDLTF